MGAKASKPRQRPAPEHEHESPAFRAAAAVEAQLALRHRREVLDHVGSQRWSLDQFLASEPADWQHTSGRDNYTSAEVQVGKRCHGFHMELLASDITPTASHYQLIHYDIPALDPDRHRVALCGAVDRPRSLSLAELKALPAESHAVLMACAGTGRAQQRYRLWTHVPWGPDSIGCAVWTGTPLAAVLAAAGPLPAAAQVVFSGADKGVEKGKVQYYERSMTLEEAMRGHVLLVYAMNGEALPPAHGAPVRLIVPGWYGCASVKWLTKIEVRTDQDPWWGPQMSNYCFKRTAADPGVPLQQLPVRALMAPPGIPDFVSRTRLVPPGTVLVKGKAYCGAQEVARVEFSSDNGASWRAARLVGTKNGSFGWVSWECEWEGLRDGEVAVICCRAFDHGGRRQDSPSEQTFNWGSFGSTQPQQVYVKCSAALEPGCEIDLIPEQKAAKEALEAESGLSKELASALYQAPGSQ